MKTLLITTALILAASPAFAGSRVMLDCDDAGVEKTLLRVTKAEAVLATANVRSNDPTEVRYCRSEVLTSNGRMAEVVYELRWTSETDNRFWLQIKAGHWF
jgi:hypothetical protein